MNNNWYEMELEVNHHRQELLEQMQKARRVWPRRRSTR